MANVWSDSCHFMPLRAIAKKHGISHEYARKLIARMALKLRNTAEEDKAIYTGKLETIAWEAFQRWLKSCEVRKRVVVKTSENGGETVEYGDEQNGDVSFLNAAMAAIDRIFRLNGLGVADATQEMGDSVAKLRQDMLERARKHMEATEGPATNTVSSEGPDASGNPSVPDIASPIQRDDPLP